MRTSKPKTDESAAPTTKNRKRDYHIAISSGGSLITTLFVSADCVRNALVEAYIKESGRQGKPPEDLEADE